MGRLYISDEMAKTTTRNKSVWLLYKNIYIPRLGRIKMRYGKPIRRINNILRFQKLEKSGSIRGNSRGSDQACAVGN